MGLDLEGRRAIVTGSGRNLGRAIALKLAQAGADVVVNSRSTLDEADEVADEIRGMGRESLAVVADVSSHDGASHLVDRALAAFGGIEIFVNVVGISPRVPILELTNEDWRVAHAVNVDSLFYGARAVLPGMMKLGWGRIVAVTGHAHIRGDEGRSHIASSKAAAVGFMHSLAREVGKYGILANVVAPGSFDTSERTRYYRDFGQGHGDRHNMMQMIALDRLGNPQELAAACLFLCSEDASYITGQSLLVNGGMYMT